MEIKRKDKERICDIVDYLMEYYKMGVEGISREVSEDEISMRNGKSKEYYEELVRGIYVEVRGCEIPKKVARRDANANANMGLGIFENYKALMERRRK
jgi:hypothetical protein